MIEVQEPAQPGAILDRGVVVLGVEARLDELVVDSLVMPLAVVVLDVLSDDSPEMALAERNDVVEAFAADAANEALGEGVEVGALGRKPQGFNPGVAQDDSER